MTDDTRRAQIAARLEKFKADRLDSLPADVAITYLLAELALADAEVGRLTLELAKLKIDCCSCPDQNDLCPVHDAGEPAPRREDSR